MTSAAFAQGLLETINVTAERRAVSTAELARNSSDIDAESLALLSQTHINEALARLPGTWISRGNGQEHLTAIRSPVLTGAGACGAFLVLEDGLASRPIGFCNVNQLFELNSEQASAIQVLRGPGSSLYGSNAVHGIINVLGQKRPEKTQADIGLEAGPHDFTRLKFQQTYASTSHAFSLAMHGSSDGGYEDDSGYDQQKFSLKHFYDSERWTLETALSASNLNQETAGFIQGRDAFKDESRKKGNPNPEAYRDARSVRLWSRLNLELGKQSAIEIRPYFRYQSMEFLQHFLPWKALEENGSRSGGLQSAYSTRISAGDTNADVTIGLDLELARGFLRETQAEAFSPTIPAGVHYDYDVDSTVAAPYARIDWPISARSTVQASLRYDYQHFDYKNNTGATSACAASVANCRFTPPASGSQHFGDWSPGIGLLYSWRDKLSSFLNVSRGFRAPQATELFRLQAGQQLAELDSERIDALELGLRGRMAATEFEWLLFAMHKDNFIFQDTQRQNVSGGKTEHYGVEWNSRTRLSKAWHFSLSGSYAVHRYRNSILLSNTSDIKGNDIDTAPRYSFNARLHWQANAKLQSELEWYRLGTYYQNPENTIKYAGHDLLNLHLKYQLNQRWQLAARLRNLLDTDYAERADFGFGNNRYFVGEPRSLYVSVELQL